MSYAIARQDEGLKSYASLSVGADQGHPGLAWTQERDKALQFHRMRDANLFLRFYVGEHDKPHCRATELDSGADG